MPMGNNRRDNRTCEMQSPPDGERRCENRRKDRSEGYTYIPMVGWYCRRERVRRGEEFKNCR